MPTPSTAKWPRPKSEDEWEEMVLDAMRLLWRDPNAQRNGRRGQRQHSVDVFGKAGSFTVAAQAKNMDALCKKDAMAEIAKAEAFQPPIHEFYFVIGGTRDASFQEFIRLLSDDRNSKGKFAVHVLFFEEVCQQLSLDNRLVIKYWSAFLWLFALANAVPKALTGPVMDCEAAADRLMALEEFKAFTTKLESASGGEVHALMFVDQIPKLDAPPGNLERSWQVVIAECHKTPHLTSYQEHIVTLCRVAVDVDTGSLLFCPAGGERWLSRDEWQDMGLWFLQPERSGK